MSDATLLPFPGGDPVVRALRQVEIALVTVRRPHRAVEDLHDSIGDLREASGHLLAALNL